MKLFLPPMCGVVVGLSCDCGEEEDELLTNMHHNT